MTESPNPDSAIDPVAEHPRDGVAGVGARLRVAREVRHLTVSDVAQTLKLGARQVEALENGDWQVLPGQTFIRGFVRNYARLLQIDPAPLMDLLDTSLEKPGDSLHVPTSRPMAMPTGHPRRDRTVVFAGVVLVIAALAAYFLLPGDLSALRQQTQGLIDSLARKEAPAAPVVENAPTSAPAVAEPVFPPGATPQQVMNPQAQAPAEMAPAQLSAPAAAPSGEAAQLRFVFAKESWVEVRDRDNKVVFSQRNPAGVEQSFGGQGPLSVVIGNAPGVALFWRGQAVDLAPHTKGEVARLVLE
jgi:cytoskeleton protein RodZ